MRKTVLIVEDNASVRHAFCELFDVCGVAENGREAIQAPGRHHPDFIVPDLFMPQSKDLDAAGAMRPVVPNVPPILYSTLDDRLSGQTRPIRISDIMSKVDPPGLPLNKARALVDVEVGR